MVQIKASCPQCGQVELTPADVSLVVYDDAELSYYSFDCEGCDQEVRKHADDYVISLLTSGGVVARVENVPLEAAEDKSGEPLTYDDLLEFALELGTTDYLAGVDNLPPL